MALYLKVSNSLEVLSMGLAQELKASHSRVFEQHLIVTQTEGMNNWLKLQMAEYLGIAANCRFLKPNDLIHQIYFLMDGHYTEMLSGRNLTWLLYKLLGEDAFRETYPAVATYYHNTEPDSDLKRMALAERTADLFDQYQIYRPEMIREWNEQAEDPLAKMDWQQYLWGKAKKVSGNTLPDKTIVGQHILDMLKNPDQQALLAERMSTVHLFGLSIITAYHVQILHELSAFIDVHFHIINPSPELYWFEDKSEKQQARWRLKGRPLLESDVAGNPLLMGWGRVVQDTFGLFFQYDAFINAYDSEGVVVPEPDTLLNKIQHDIFNNANENRNRIFPEDIEDGSITINNCYTVAREVEVLYNYLVHLIDRKKETLSPRDIVVMVRDIDAYAPYIKAIFNNAPYKFRYTIADESYADSDNLFNALHAILRLNEENFKAEEVLQLLDSSYIRKRFGINNVPLVRSVVDQANIRFGIHGAKEDETFLVSWKYGIRRIMFGICMSGGEEYGKGDDSFFPLDILEGSDSLEVIRFCHFAEVLITAVEERKKERSISGWVEYIENLLHNMVYEPDEEVDEDYNTLMQQLADYNLLNEYMSDTVTFDVFSHSFLQTLTGTTRTGLFVNGGITFCSLIPMRSIPFRVVAMLGLDYDKFPRREQPIGFNLMEKNKQRGDRNVKDNDKHLFLETVLSARQYLYISYVGQSAKDNSRMPPSALVDELLDYIETGTDEPDLVRSQLVTRQPLQGFSRKYMTGDERLYSYLNTTVPERPITRAGKVMEPLVLEEVDLDELVRFFKNPFKAYYNKVLGIYYNDEQVLLNETEIFHLDSLQKWNLKNELLQMDANAIANMKIRLVKTGRLPLKNMAYVALQQIESEVQPVRDKYRTCINGAEEQSVQVNLDIEGTLLKGTIHSVFDGKLVQVSWSKREDKYLIEAYIRYLAGRAAGVLTGMCFISGASKQEAFEAMPLEQDEALRRLTALMDIFRDGFERITPFYPDFDIKPADVADLDFGKFVKKVDKALDKGDDRTVDPYIFREYENGFFSDEATLDTYKIICAHVLLPLAELIPGYYN
ncbi:exodeoxyribonuclease V subunit gamma [Chitinophaga filiformis]|uniref:exodeoxyribonuclease V subunit gamma n=1 Tax=Chitinophaga filiformis TaxID=104663 RepID=UPI001F1F34FE|nr:exodeoxyribonuclease V subunit gamma [Chitinophaga filiformis]MCF6402593.1 exodeoxyribonuclease V subunit gamma [Chitinophaga filiformis]MCF6403489.1 exodeoxyribonuclease V subunit gamma [Chitinophaga filiformis]